MNCRPASDWRLIVAPGRVSRRALAMGLACAVGVMAAPHEAAAQKDAFVQALIAFRTAIAGTHGDEGLLAMQSLDRLSGSLAAWDRDLERTLADLRVRLAAGPHTEHAPLRMRIATLMHERGRTSEALAELDLALAEAPADPLVHLYRGALMEVRGETDAAADEYDRAWVLSPGDPMAAYLVATRGRGARADGEDARSYLPETHPIETHLIETLYSAADDPGATQVPAFMHTSLIADRAADWPVFAPALYAEGFRLIAQRRYTEAAESLRGAASGDPLIVDEALQGAGMVRGIGLLREQRFVDAIGHLEGGVTSAPGSSEVHRILGLAYGATEREADGIVQLQTAVRLAPDDERARVALARALVRAGLGADAEALLRETLHRLPQSADARFALADLYEQQGKGPDAIVELEAAAAADMLAGRGALLWRIADLYHRHQDFERVTRALSERARLEPGHAVVHKDLGLAHMRRGERQAALIELLMGAALGGDDPETLATIGQIHLESERYDRAIPVLERALAQAPDLAQARFALGTALVRSGRTDEGRQHLAEFQRLRMAALEEQRRTFTRETLRRDADAHTSEGRHGAAAAVWREIAELEPDEPAHRIALSGALIRAAQLEEAAEQLERAAVLGGGANVYRQLASLYERLGRTEDSARAQTEYERLSGARTVESAPVR